MTETSPAAEAADAADRERERERERQEAERERQEWERRLKPVPDLGDGYLMAEWPGSGRHHLVFEGERIGYAEKKPFTTRWEAHGPHGTKVPGSGTYGTRGEALAEVARHHRRYGTTGRP